MFTIRKNFWSPDGDGGKLMVTQFHATGLGEDAIA